MKKIVLNKQAKYVVIAIAALMLIFSSSMCSAQAVFLTSSVVPAARGTVDVKKDKYNNYTLQLKVSNFSEASRLTPPKNTYVVWMVTEDNLTKNIGQVRTKKSFFSKKLKASFKTISSFRPIKIFITAEYDPDLQSPGDVIVLTTDFFTLPKK